MKAGILAIDIGGSGLKAAVIDERGAITGDHLRIPTPHPCPPTAMVSALKKLIEPLKGYNRISVGFPGVIRDGVVLTAPNLGTEQWAGFDLATAISASFGKHPTKVINDAEMQGFALISDQGLELVLTLGTGFGTALYRDGVLMPHMEIGQHIARKKKTYDQYVGDAALQKIGHKRWNRRLKKTLSAMEGLLYPERIFIGGGNGCHIDFELPAHIQIGSNEAGLEGGAALWRKHTLRKLATNTN